MPPMFKQDQEGSETGGKQKTRKFVNGGQQSKVFSATVMTLTVLSMPCFEHLKSLLNTSPRPRFFFFFPIYFY